MVENWNWFFLELTNRCNFDCTFCPSGISERPRRDVDRRLALGLVDQLHEMEFDGRLFFHLLGEPLLHPAILQIVDHAAGAGMQPVILTNGGALTRETVRDVLASRASELVISMQTINRPSYNLLRRTPVDWDTYLDRIQAALAAADEAEKGPTFRVSMGIKKADVAHPEDLYFVEYESTEQIKESIAVIFERVNGGDLAGTYAELDSHGPAAGWRTQVTDRVSLSVKPMGNWRRMWRDEPKTSGRCRWFGKEMGILSNGDVVFCHLDYDGRTAIGNVNERPLADVIGAPAFVEMAGAFASGAAVASGCEYCNGVKAH